MFHPVTPSSPQPLTTPELSVVSVVPPFSERHTDRIIQDVAFSDWLLSLSEMHLRTLRLHGVFVLSSWRDGPLLLSAEYHPLPGRTRVFARHLPKDTLLVPSAGSSVNHLCAGLVRTYVLSSFE